MSEQPQFEIVLEQPFHQALEEVENALKSLGFTILTRVDVQRMMKDQMHIDFHPYIILGACDTPIASRALEIDASIGLMLPCNVSVETDLSGHTRIRVADPTDSLGCRAAENPQLAHLAIEASQRMCEIIALLQSSTRPSSPEAKPWDRLAHTHHE
jgi:uncharacterized protein (DUF302 family)